jgi:hypothetical protein
MAQKKTRMNDELRYKICRALFIHATVDRNIVYAAASTKLAERVVTDILGPDGVKLMKKVPAGWLSRQKGVRVNAGGWNTFVGFYEVVGRDVLVKQKMEERSHYGNSFEVTQPTYDIRQLPEFFAKAETSAIKDPNLIADIQAFMTEQEKWREEASNLRAKISSTVSGFRYLEDLLDAIPDVGVLLPNVRAEAVPKESALVTTAKELMCAIAKTRGEEREGCCDGNLVTEETPALAEAA